MVLGSFNYHVSQTREKKHPLRSRLEKPSCHAGVVMRCAPQRGIASHCVNNRNDENHRKPVALGFKCFNLPWLSCPVLSCQKTCCLQPLVGCCCFVQTFLVDPFRPFRPWVQGQTNSGATKIIRCMHGPVVGWWLGWLPQANCAWTWEPCIAPSPPSYRHFMGKMVIIQWIHCFFYSKRIFRQIQPYLSESSGLPRGHTSLKLRCGHQIHASGCGESWPRLRGNQSNWRCGEFLAMDHEEALRMHVLTPSHIISYYMIVYDIMLLYVII